MADNQNYAYTAQFCEENVWLLARRLIDEGISSTQLQVLFFSNKPQSVILLQQSAVAPNSVMAWDYHVVLQLSREQSLWVYDLDTRLDVPCPAQDYFEQSFPVQAELPPEYRARVRAIPSQAYLSRFYSDRSHMHGVIPKDSFPPYPCLTAAPGQQAITLTEYRDMHKPLDDGSRIADLDAYLKSL